MPLRLALLSALLLFAYACGGDHASPPPSSMPPAIASAHESKDPRPAVPTSLEREAGAPEITPPPPPIVLTPDAGADGTVTNGKEVVANQKAKLRACYAKSPADKKNKGALVVHLEIDGSGAVSALKVAQNDGYATATLVCLNDVLGNAKFVVNGGHGSVDVPVSWRDLQK